NYDAQEDELMTDEEKRIAEAQIRGLIDGFAKAFRAKNIHGVMSIFAPGIVSFDLTPPLQCVGANALKTHWEKTFSSYEGPIAYEIHDPNITVGNDVAFSHSLNRTSGTLTNGQRIERWLRWTACFRKINDTWLVTHEHVSVPIDVESHKTLFGLKPKEFRR